MRNVPLDVKERALSFYLVDVKTPNTSRPLGCSLSSKNTLSAGSKHKKKSSSGLESLPKICKKLNAGLTHACVVSNNPYKVSTQSTSKRYG